MHRDQTEVKEGRAGSGSRRRIKYSLEAVCPVSSKTWQLFVAELATPSSSRQVRAHRFPRVPDLLLCLEVSLHTPLSGDVPTRCSVWRCQTRLSVGRYQDTLLCLDMSRHAPLSRDVPTRSSVKRCPDTPLCLEMSRHAFLSRDVLTRFSGYVPTRSSV